MLPETTKTLKEIHTAQKAILKALDNMALTHDERIVLQKTSGKLKDMESSLVKQLGKDLVEMLNSDAADLKELTKQIRESAEKLGSISKKIENVSAKVAALISLLSKLLNAGLL